MTTSDPTCTFAEFVLASGWPQTGHRRPTTIRHFARCIRPFLDRYGDRRVGDGITTVEARTFVAAHGRDCAAAARALHNDLVELHLTRHNPFRLTPIPTPPTQRDEILTAADFADLTRLAEDVWDGHPGRVIAGMIQCLGEEGLRLGEAFAIRRADLDFDRDRLTVRCSVDAQGRLRPPVAGKRIIRLFPDTKRRLLDLTAGDSDIVFADHAGRPLTRRRLRYRWSAIAAAWEATRPDDHWIHQRLRRDAHAHLSPRELRQRAARWLLTEPPNGAGYGPVEAARHLGMHLPPSVDLPWAGDAGT